MTSVLQLMSTQVITQTCILNCINIIRTQVSSKMAETDGFEKNIYAKFTPQLIDANQCILWKLLYSSERLNNTRPAFDEIIRHWGPRNMICLVSFKWTVFKYSFKHSFLTVVHSWRTVDMIANNRWQESTCRHWWSSSFSLCDRGNFMLNKRPNIEIDEVKQHWT